MIQHTDTGTDAVSGIPQNDDVVLACRHGAWTRTEVAGTTLTKQALVEANDDLAARVVRLTADLAEKTLLLKEGYHRFKNNLQVVNSLIQLRARQNDDPAVRATLDETSQRIRAMSLDGARLSID